MAEELDTVTEKDDEISLLDLFAVLLRRKWLIIGITCVAMVFILVYSIISLKLPPEKSYLPNSYKVSANMLITDADGGGGLALSGSASSLASLMGVNLGASGGSSTSSLILYLTKSNPFYDAIAVNFNLYEKFEFEKSPIANTRTALSKKVSTEYDSSSGVLTVSYEDIDPEFAVEVVNFVVDWISSKLDELGVDNNKISKENLEKNIDTSWNEILKLTKEVSDMQDRVAQGRALWTKESTIEQKRIELELSAQQEVYKQLRSQLELLKVKMATEAPTFQILERASVPDIKSGPSRGKLCIIVTFAAFFISVFLAFLLNAVENIRKDPEAMEKLHVGKKGKK
ncbi:MAG: lipopolysaccharide biosynthesis protein [Treponema sp.]|nr:lipopolysaccharide biosynthesis protein [Treponema sp.]